MAWCSEVTSTGGGTMVAPACKFKLDEGSFGKIPFHNDDVVGYTPLFRGNRHGYIPSHHHSCLMD